jgi:acyl carrier protein phosphodiesterase
MLKERFGEEIAGSIVLHRKIDCFTDSHPEAASASHLLFPSYRHYSRVIIDVAFDHMLSINWDRFSDMKLDLFIENVYSIYKDLPEFLPSNFHHFAQRMISFNVLGSYSDFEYIKRILERMESNSKYATGISGAWKELRLYFDQIENCFFRFFPELIDYVKLETANDNHRTVVFHESPISKDGNE